MLLTIPILLLYAAVAKEEPPSQHSDGMSVGMGYFVTAAFYHGRSQLLSLRPHSPGISAES